MHRLYEKVLRHVSACRQSKGDVADTERTVEPQTLVHLTHSAQRLHRLLLLCRDCKRQAVDDDILTLEAVLLRLRNDPLGNRDTLRCRLWQPLFVHRKSEYRRPVALGEREDRIHALLFTTHRVDDDASVRHAQSRLDHLRVCRVNLQRQIDNALHRLDNVWDNLLLVHALGPDVDVEHLCARLLLGDREFLDVAVVLLDERLLQTFLPRRIDAFANDIELAILRDASR